METRNSMMEQAAKNWDSVRKQGSGPKRWWHSPAILRHINKHICGEPLEGAGAGALCELKKHAPHLPFAKGLSIGFGTGSKELRLLQEGFVSHLDLYEISAESIKMTRELMLEHDLRRNVKFHLADFFAKPVKEHYNFVYWDNSLHHMFDAEKAVKVTWEALAPGGVMFVFDYVGANRFQHTDATLDHVNRFRENLPEALFLIENKYLFEKQLTRIPLEWMIQADPSEAADSEAILPALKKHTNIVRLVTTGGCIYHTGISDILTNMADTSPFLKAALQVDDTLNKAGFYDYAFCLSKKPE